MRDDLIHLAAVEVDQISLQAFDKGAGDEITAAGDDFGGEP